MQYYAVEREQKRTAPQSHLRGRAGIIAANLSFTLVLTRAYTFGCGANVRRGHPIVASPRPARSAPYYLPVLPVLEPPPDPCSMLTLSKTYCAVLLYDLWHIMA